MTTDDIDVAEAERERERLMSEPQPDHAYLSPGDTPYADGDRVYSGCFICGKARQEHPLSTTPNWQAGSR